MSSKTPIPNFNKIGRELIKNASRYAASESVKFFKESFVKGGFTDTSFQKWSKSNSPLAGKRTMQKTYKLMRSIKKQSATLTRVVVIADSDYAEIHNNGGYITVTTQMKKYFWAKYYEFSGSKTFNVKSKKENNTKKNRKLTAKADYFKNMALMEVGSKIKIPKHQFMGNSQVMMNDFDQWFGQIIKIQVEPYFNNPSINITTKNV